MRELTDTIIERVEAGIVRPCILIYADFPSREVRVWTGDYDCEFGGETWVGEGEVVTIESISETTEIAAKGLTVRFWGVKDEYQGLLAEDYQGRDASVYLGFFGDDEELDVMEKPLFSGFLDSHESTDEGNGEDVSFNIEHRLIDMLRKTEYRYNNESQRKVYPGVTDTGLSRVEKIKELELAWGRKG